jgi:hypothetical protein
MMMDNRGTGVVPWMNALRNYSEIAGYEVYTISPNPQDAMKRPAFSFPNNALFRNGPFNFLVTFFTALDMGDESDVSAACPKFFCLIGFQ